MIFAISLFFAIILMINILLFSLMIKISVLKLKSSNIKTNLFLFLNVIKLKINMKMLSLNVFELIITTNIKILNLTFIISIMTSHKNLFILKISNKMRSSNDLIKRFLTLLTLSLKILTLIKSID